MAILKFKDPITGLWNAVKIYARSLGFSVDGVGADSEGNVPLGAVRFGVDQTSRSEADKAQARSNVGAASTDLFTAVLPIAGWAGSGPYTQTVNVAGMLNADNPIVDIVLSETAATAIAQLAAYGLVGRIDAGNGTITAICYEEKPEIDLSLMIRVVR